MVLRHCFRTFDKGLRQDRSHTIVKGNKLSKHFKRQNY